jgi:hypothetical protein
MTPVSVTVSFVGGPRDGESSRLVSREPPVMSSPEDDVKEQVWYEQRLDARMSRRGDLSS